MKRSGKVRLHDDVVGEIGETIEGEYIFKYNEGYVGEAISHTLPVQSEPYRSDELFPFFDGLIPEGWLLDITTRNWKLDASDRLGLLLTVCQDCIGAVSVHGAETKKGTSANEAEKFNENSQQEETATKVPESLKNNQTCLATLEPLKQPGLYSPKASKELFAKEIQPVLSINKDDLEQMAQHQISRQLAVTGVQRKLSLDLNHHSQVEPRLTVVGYHGNYILKPQSHEFSEMPEIEHLTMCLAKAAGFNLPPFALIAMKDGEFAYITRRFDRLKKKKVMVEDFCQLSEKQTEQKYRSSMESAGKVIGRFADVPGDDHLSFFDLSLFCFITGNADMHLKNFSLWKDPKSELTRLTPFYDLVSTRLLLSEKEDPEETALPINGKKAKLKRDDFEKLAENLKIPEKVTQRTIDRYTGLENKFASLIERSFLSAEKKANYLELIQQRIKRLN